ncbi:MAG: radical SAM protein [Candidatus Aminicenantaceae bacterium]
MINILLTNYCNRNCSYCFARAQVEVGARSPKWDMSIEELDTILSYLKPGQDVVSLLGGEPALHSHFKDIVRYVFSRGYEFKVFTNATIPQLRQALSDIPKDGNKIIVNLNPPVTYTKNELVEIEANCRALGEKINLSFNIYTGKFSWDFLRDAIEEWNLGRMIRIGIAQPIQSVTNVFLREEEMSITSRRIVSMVEDLVKDGIAVGFDCGFQLCMFSEEERGILAECGTEFQFECRPVLDIGKDLVVWRCFPLSTFEGVKLKDFNSISELRQYFEREWSEEQSRGNKPECRDCIYLKNGTCKGGCLSRTLSMLQGEKING